MNFDETRVREALAVLHPDNQLFEIRVIEDNKIFSGYFNTADDCIRELNALKSSGQVYITLNSINPACSSREQSGHIMFSKTTTSDKDIDTYRYLFIDLDPVRPSGVSSTDKELESARDLAGKIARYLKSHGFCEPILSCSGNGYHLLYRVEFQNNEANRSLVKRFLVVLDLLFSNEHVKVDKANCNPARICKLYGTTSAKGKSTVDRPHRLSTIINVPEVLQVTDIKYVRSICDLLEQAPKPEKTNKYNPKTFDVGKWLEEHSIEYNYVESGKFQKYILAECPFDSSHKAPDSAIIKMDNGAIIFNCFHNSCADKTWADVRRKIAPNEQDIAAEQREKEKYTPNKVAKPSANINDIWLTPDMIASKPGFPRVYVRTGITKLDEVLKGGLCKGEVSIVAGLSGAGKSTLLSMLILNAIDYSQKVACFSGELTDKRFMDWLYLQAAGRDNLIPLPNGYFDISKEDAELMRAWLQGSFWLYNNDYNKNPQDTLDNCRKIIAQEAIDLLILDNLAVMNVGMNEKKLDEQTRFIEELEVIAKNNNVHILLVCHPRKTMSLMRREDIAGAGNLLNLADNCFLLHRNNQDFKNRITDIYTFGIDEEALKGTNIIEVAKDRENGTMDFFIPLFYDSQSKRLKNTPQEMRHYSWEKQKIK